MSEQTGMSLGGPGTAVEEVEVVGDEPAVAVQPPRVFSVSELRTQVDVANSYPRDVFGAVTELRSIVLSSEDAADSMFYGLKRDNKQITGPSIRFAECLVYAWGNLRVYGREVEQTHSDVVCEGYAWDIQRNAAVAKQVHRRIVNKHGSRYSTDMIVTTSNAAVSIGIRNATLAIVPRPIWEPVYKAAFEMAIRKNKPIEELRKNALTWWCDKVSREESELLAYLGVESMDNVGHGQLHLLRGLRTGVEDGSLVLDYEIERALSKQEDSEEETRALAAALREAGA